MPVLEKIEADGRIKTLIENSAKLGHRAVLALLGEDGREQVMVIHHLIAKALGERPSVLWCHKKDSDVPRQSRKQLKKLEKRLTSGKCDISQENAFDIFLLSTSVRYCSLSDTQRVLGSTYGMCIIQDFEGLTPNTICRIVETVRGGGVIVFLMSGMKSLRKLFNLTMHSHQRLKTYSHPKITPLFNERFVLSLAWCKSALVVNNKLQVVTELKALAKGVQPLAPARLEAQELLRTQLVELQKSLEDGEKPLPQLVGCCKTLDQGKAVLKMIDVITDRGTRGTVSVTAGRGRGKSAALGLAVAAAVHFGLGNIFATSPSPENLNTFFEFVFKGFDALGYEEQNDYEIIQSTNEEFNEAVVRVNVFREFRQTIQYIDPADAKKLTQCELLVIDEAAAIPLPQVKALIGNYNVFMSSTISGYEGTGRSLSLKLIQQLRQQSSAGGATASKAVDMTAEGTSRSLHEVNLGESVRYSAGDPVEHWIHKVLCLDASSDVFNVTSCPPPHTCQLYYVNRDVLFSGHRESEEFLQQIMSLLVSSHYRNSPDDLQVLCDAPAHHLFVLLPPIVPGMSTLPPVLAVLQLTMEGGIPHSVASDYKSRGERPAGDLVPWTLVSQFLDPNLAELTGARVIRIAAHPDYQGMGYGSQTISLLSDYYSGKHIPLDDELDAPIDEDKVEVEEEGEAIVPRKREKPLLSKLSEKIPEPLDYLSVSYGVTLPLAKFWTKAGYSPLYVSQVPNKVTGEHSCVMVKPVITVHDGDAEERKKWMKKPCKEFRRRFSSLLSGPLSSLPALLALKLIQAHTEVEKEIEWNELQNLVSGHDIQRLEKYSNNLVDRHLINDLLPSIAGVFFQGKFPSVHLSVVQSSLLLGMGLQFKSLDDVVKHMDIPVESAIGQFNRALRRLLKAITTVQETALARHLPSYTSTIAEFTPVDISLQDDLEMAAEDYKENNKKKGKVKVKSKLLGDVSKFAIRGDDKAWESALVEGPSSNVTIKSVKRPATMTAEQLEMELEKVGKEMEAEVEEPKAKKKKGAKISGGSKGHEKKGGGGKAQGKKGGGGGKAQGKKGGGGVKAQSKKGGKKKIGKRK